MSPAWMSQQGDDEPLKTFVCHVRGGRGGVGVCEQGMEGVREGAGEGVIEGGVVFPNPHSLRHVLTPFHTLQGCGSWARRGQGSNSKQREKSARIAPSTTPSPSYSTIITGNVSVLASPLSRTSSLWSFLCSATELLLRGATVLAP